MTGSEIYTIDIGTILTSMASIVCIIPHFLIIASDNTALFPRTSAICICVIYNDKYPLLLLKSIGLEVYGTVPSIMQTARNSLAKSDKRSNVV